MTNPRVSAKSPSLSPHEPAAAGVTARDVIRALERAGFQEMRTSGSHVRLIHMNEPARKVTVPVHAGDLKRGIIAQAGLTVEEFLKLI